MTWECHRSVENDGNATRKIFWSRSKKVLALLTRISYNRAKSYGGNCLLGEIPVFWGTKAIAVFLADPILLSAVQFPLKVCIMLNSLFLTILSSFVTKPFPIGVYINSNSVDIYRWRLEYASGQLRTGVLVTMSSNTPWCTVR